MKIILLTSNYPYGKGESFILPELPYLLNSHAPEIIAVNAHDEAARSKDVEDGIRYSKLFERRFSPLAKIMYSVRCVFSKTFHAEITMLRRQKRMNGAVLRELLAFQARGERIFRALAKRFQKELRTNPSRLVLYSYWMVDSAYAIAKLRQKYGCKAFSRAHGGDLYEDRHRLGYAPMRSYLFQNLNAVYTVSRGGRDYLTNKYGYADRIHCSYLGTSNISGIREINSRSVFRVVTCAYIVKLKRIPLFVEALSLITDKAIEWIHFGDGPERESVIEAIKHLPPNIRYELKGNTPHDEILAYYKDNDVHLFVNTSSSEGLPVSIMEAISFGVPVIATDVGGTNEIVQNCVNGYLVSEDITASELAEVILKVMNAPNVEYEILRKNAFSFWNECFNAEKNYQLFYEELLGKGGVLNG
ncbi:MAG: glycosyltransferase [Clostridia bacterium]|nr:glycosyltransferase [Clostridia bacterium]